jgi:uncharacterized protein
MRSADEVAGMPCPVCKVPLTMSDRQGIEIDYCPQCRGVWLDRGELDKIIERNAATSAPAPQAQQQVPQQPQYAPPPFGQQHHDPYYGKHGYKRKKHWLNEIFD